jgi:lipopolysaccharide export system permease protein
MKKLHRLVLLSFLPNFSVSFAVALFVLVLQFMAKYQDDIFGKGLSTSLILKLFGYASFQLSVLAMPLGILVGSLMTLGRLGENYELSAIKASGISLWRVIYPIFIFTLILTGITFSFTSYVIPWANLKLYSLLYDLSNAKPEFTLKPGSYYKGIDGYAIRILERTPQGTLKDVHIYDHSANRGNLNVLLADSAYMEINEEYMYLKMTLFNGRRYEEVYPEDGKPNLFAHSTFYFDKMVHYFDLSGFKLERTDEKLFASHQYMLNIKEIQIAVDSLKIINDSLKKEAKHYLEPILHWQESLPLNDTTSYSLIEYNKITDLIDKSQREMVIARAQNTMRSIKNFLEFAIIRKNQEKTTLNKYEYEFYNKYTMPLACLIMLFIGAPLGAIIRKGGMGLPTIVSIAFFIVFYVLLTYGKKMSRDDVISAYFGASLPAIVMIPMAIFITFQASSDSRLFDLHAWKSLFYKIRTKIFSKKS